MFIVPTKSNEVIGYYQSPTTTYNAFGPFPNESTHTIPQNTSPFLIDSRSVTLNIVNPGFAPFQVVSCGKNSRQNVQSKPHYNNLSQTIKKKSKENKNKRQKFTPEEDEKLKELVETMGSKKWEAIAKEMPGRTGRQCRDRYKNYLVPGFFNGQWSREEDELLFKKYIEYGSQWSKITQFFSNRSSNALKNRWNYFVSRNLFINTNYETSNYNNETAVINDQTNDDESYDSDQDNDEVLYENVISYSSISNPYLDPFDYCGNDAINQNDELNCKEDIFGLNI